MTRGHWFLRPARIPIPPLQQDFYKNLKDLMNTCFVTGSDSFLQTTTEESYAATPARFYHNETIVTYMVEPGGIEPPTS